MKIQRDWRYVNMVGREPGERQDFELPMMILLEGTSFFTLSPSLSLRGEASGTENTVLSLTETSPREESLIGKMF